MSEHDFFLDCEIAVMRCRNCGITEYGARAYEKPTCSAYAPQPPPADDPIAEAVRKMPVGFDAIDRQYRK